jgi:hypothetical protein
MTRFDIKRMWPQASESFILANLDTPHPIRKKTPTIASQAQESANHDNPDSLVSHSKPSKQKRALDRHHEGEAQSAGRPHVCFTLCRVRLLDVDAKYGSVKDLLDGCAYAGLVVGDREDQITLEVRQEKVSHYEDEKTVIQITYP